MMRFGPKNILQYVESIQLDQETPLIPSNQQSPAEFDLQLISEAFPGSQQDIEKQKSTLTLQQQQSTDDNSESIYNSSSANNIEQPVKRVQTEEEIKLQKIKEEFRNDIQNQNWQEGDSKKQLKGFKINTEEKGMIWTLGEGIIEGSIQDAADLFQNIENIDKFKVINSYAKDIKVVKNLENGITIRYTESSPPFGKNIYGFFMSKKEYDQENGIYYFYGTSTQKPSDVEIKDLHKKKDSLVFYDAFILEQLKGEQNKFKLQYINKMNVGTEIPNWIQNRIKNNRALDIIKSVNEYVQKCEKQRKKQKKQ
ncbi:hypothetical protein PPERSA_05293 [Pseudocohnilembus persalinus]|uniref:START domain-containing protein n=1 Tax=Pseudocohnilembus persalinus TaxID=266149 RepID=A0A0V0R5W9_PSEPJ|nr:hypothetical protein PPERSA_05293 [Pseudocohnilembus persalinus]|eukprot:KRX09901.1 hypothetical protein PPERSA_05293 [Pseudocohnilembus persalinus]